MELERFYELAWESRRGWLEVERALGRGVHPLDMEKPKDWTPAPSMDRGHKGEFLAPFGYTLESIPDEERDDFHRCLAIMLRDNAYSRLAPRTRFEIRSEVPMSYGRQMGMAWYSNLSMQAEKTWQTNGLDSWSPVKRPPKRMDGHYLVARCVTPKEAAKGL